MALVLLVTSVVMFLVELAVRFDVDRGRMIKVDPDVKAGRWGRFLLLCLLIYAVEVGLLTLIIGVAGFGFFRTAGEFGFHNNPGGYYKPWFTIMDTIRSVYVYGGLPYVIFTRALQYSPKSDPKQAAFTVIKALRRLLDRVSPSILGALDRAIPGGIGKTRPFDRFDRTALLGLVVKGFYVPLMTVFFVDQFTHLVKNFSWMTGPNFSLAAVNLRDVHNVSHSFIFAVDVGLAWCGYVVSSRWIKNTTFSAEPTFWGWFVAVACYPPHNRLLGVYYGTPGEDAFFAIPNPRVVTFFAILSILSFCVYTSATVVFGLRFSNVTHRGVITTGPDAYIRHPAYASKNFSWWCVMLPFVLWQIWNNHNNDPAHMWEPALQILGMFLMSFIYYQRALTEERHLARDPEYRKYMEKVPYRFIPGVL
jgi:protein-S-isoprenylcysteine O-methyltransferase Ste14